MRARFGPTFPHLFALLALCITVLPLLAGATAVAAQDSSSATPQPSGAGQAATFYELPDAARILSYAPNGTMVVGTKDLGGGTLCTYAVPSGDTIACADLDERRIDFEITDINWSPDSTTVVFAERPFMTLKDGDLWTMDAATGELTNITDDRYEGALPFIRDVEASGPIYADMLPRWSPDSSTIAFSRTVVTTTDDPAPNELWTLDVATGEGTRVASITADEPGVLYGNLAWAPDAATIYISIIHPDMSNPENGIWAVDVATGDREQVLGAGDRFEGAAPAVMAVSPRGDYLTIYYPQYIGQFGLEEGGYALLSLDQGTTVPLEVPAELISDVPALTVLPGFTADGATVLFAVRRYQSPMGALVALHLDTGETETVAVLPEDRWPIPSSLWEGVRIGENGTAFVLTQINGGYLVPIPEPIIGEPPIPATPAPVPVVTAEPTALPNTPAAGTSTGTIQGRFVRVYAAPSADAPIVLTLGSGDTVEIIGEPVATTDGTWIPIRDPETGTIGYVRDESLVR